MLSHNCSQFYFPISLIGVDQGKKGETAIPKHVARKVSKYLLSWTKFLSWWIVIEWKGLWKYAIYHLNKPKRIIWEHSDSVISSPVIHIICLSILASEEPLTGEYKVTIFIQYHSVNWTYCTGTLMANQGERKSINLQHVEHLTFATFYQSIEDVLSCEWHIRCILLL